MKKLLAIFTLCLVFAGCAKPYDVPVFVDIGNSETGFLIKNEGDGKQASTKTEKLLAENRVQAMRIMIPYRWVDTGFQKNEGKYIPEAQLILVDRAPVTRRWTAGSTTGTSNKNEALWVESSDSVNFSTGIELVARIISEEDAVKFLFNYPANKCRVVKTNCSYKDDYAVHTVGLDEVMDTEVRSVLQRIFAEQSAMYPMEVGRDKKNEWMKAMREEASAYFKDRGITITSIGMFGGLTYENPDIQKSIDKTFQAQMDRVVAKAEFEAATVRKTALQAIGEGEAAKILAIKMGEAKGIQAVADAKAYELQKLQENPTAYLALKQIEVQSKMLETWDGRMPVYMMGSGQGMGMLLSAPSVDLDKLPPPKPKVKVSEVIRPAEAR